MMAISLLLIALTPIGPAQINATDLDGRKVQLPVAGKPTCLIFVATECPIANRLTPELGRIAADYKEVAFFVVYSDASAGKSQIRKHIKEYGMPGTAILDPKQAVARFAKATVTPESALFDASQKMVYHGRINDLFTEHNVASDKVRTHDLRDALTAVLAGKPIANPFVAPVGCAIAFRTSGGRI